MVSTQTRLEAPVDEVASLEREFAAGQERMVELLTTAMAIHRADGLRAELATRAGASSFALDLNRGGPFLILDNRKIVSSAMVGAPLGELPRVELWSSAKPLVAFASAHRAARLEAERLMVAMSQDGEGFHREAFLRLVRWAPIVAADGYRQTALLGSIFDLVRRSIIDSPAPDALRAYWTNVHLLGHLTMLSVAADPSGWLAEMAHTLAWQSWTPSFPLVRERISRLAVRGAWAAVRFGPTMVERYLGKLDSPHLLRVFDAVLSLVAIASANDGERNAIARELYARLGLRRARAQPDEQAAIDALVRSAGLALDAPDAAARAVARDHAAARIEERVASAIATDRDAAEVDEHGYFPCILAMATLATAPASLFFPRETQVSPARWRPRRALETISRTLGARTVEWN